VVLVLLLLLLLPLLLLLLRVRKLFLSQLSILRDGSRCIEVVVLRFRTLFPLL
jgi:hypothetical protein